MIRASPHICGLQRNSENQNKELTIAWTLSLVCIFNYFFPWNNLSIHSFAHSFIHSNQGHHKWYVDIKMLRRAGLILETGFEMNFAVQLNPLVRKRHITIQTSEARWVMFQVMIDLKWALNILFCCSFELRIWFWSLDFHRSNSLLNLWHHVKASTKTKNHFMMDTQFLN